MQYSHFSYMSRVDNLCIIIIIITITSTSLYDGTEREKNPERNCSGWVGGDIKTGLFIQCTHIDIVLN